MPLKNLLFLLTCALLTLSCGEQEQEGSQGFSLILPGLATIIPSEVSSCSTSSDKDLSNAYFRMRSANILWERTDQELLLTTLRVDIKSSSLGGDFRDIMDSTDLSELFVIETEDGNTAIQEGVVPPNSKLVLRSTCSLGFGGLNIPDGSRSFTAEAILTLDGVAVGTQEGEGGNLGEEALVRTTQRVRLNYSFD